MSSPAGLKGPGPLLRALSCNWGRQTFGGSASPRCSPGSGPVGPLPRPETRGSERRTQRHSPPVTGPPRVSGLSPTTRGPSPRAGPQPAARLGLGTHRPASLWQRPLSSDKARWTQLNRVLLGLSVAPRLRPPTRGDQEAALGYPQGNGSGWAPPGCLPRLWELPL